MSYAKNAIDYTPESGLNDGIFSKILRTASRVLHFPAFRTTLRTMFRVPVTTLYAPGKDHSHYPAVSHRYRGLLALSQKACTGCKKCERICPNNCIIMETRDIDGDEYRFPGYFSGRCMKCGLCEEVCDRQWAIRHTDQWEDAGYVREQLYYGPERMFDMWEKHIEPRIQAGLTHKSVPDKRRWNRENIHEDDEPPKAEIPEEFHDGLDRHKEDKPINAPISLWKDK